MTHALQIVDNGLARVNNRVQNARQTLTRVNDATAKLGDRIEASSPLVTALSQLVDNDLAPRIENARTTAFAIHDAVVTVNSTLVALNRLPGITVPTLTPELGSVSERAQEAQTVVQDLRVTLAEMKAGLVTKAEAAVTKVTARIDAALARIQAIVNKYQATVTRTLARISTTSNTLLLLIDVLTVSLIPTCVHWYKSHMGSLASYLIGELSLRAQVGMTLLLVIFEAGLVLLMYVCWQYVRTGRFPSLRVVRTS